MPAHASIRTGYSVRILIISLALIIGGLWFLYDGMVAYPEQRERYLAYQQIRQDYPDWQTRWQAQAEEEGWPLDVPDERTEGDILVQRIIAALLLPAGVVMGVFYLRLLRRWIASDEQGLRTSGGRHAPWEAIQAVDKSRWQRKGIARVQYDDGGVQREIKLDDWKYDTEATEKILLEVDAHLQQRQGDSDPQGEGDATADAGDDQTQVANQRNNDGSA